MISKSFWLKWGFYILFLFFIATSVLFDTRESRDTHTHVIVNDAAKHDRLSSRVYPRLQGGLGNQLFVMAVSAIVANETCRVVVVNAQQSSVISYGSPQPVFWHTIFHSHVFLKDDNYAEVNAHQFDEVAFESALKAGFQNWKRSTSSLSVQGAFIRFDLLAEYREFLQVIFRPSNEVQRWVNDAALKLKLVSRASDTSSLSASVLDESYAKKRLNPNVSLIENAIVNSETGAESSECRDLALCRVPTLECSMPSCADNILLHLRLQDASTFADHWSEDELELTKSYLWRSITSAKHRVVVVVFSNDPTRARHLMENGGEYSEKLTPYLEYGNSIDVIEFVLMSQYFGTHIFSSSTFQSWALFLSEMKRVRVLTLPGANVQKLRDSSLFPHLIFEDIK
jgi:hypothetical protein